MIHFMFVFYILGLAYSYGTGNYICYSDVDDPASIEQHCRQWDGLDDQWSVFKPLSEFTAPASPDDSAVIMISKTGSELNYDKYVRNENADRSEPVIYFVAAPLPSATSAKALDQSGISMTLTTAMTEPVNWWDGHGSYQNKAATVKFQGFSSITIKNMASTERNTLYVSYLPVSVEDVCAGLFKSSDSRRVELFVSESVDVSLNQVKQGALDIITLEYYGWLRVYIPKLDDSLHETEWVFIEGSTVYLDVYGDDIQAVLCTDGLKIIQNGKWFKVKGKYINVYSDYGWTDVELTIEDGVRDISYISPRLFSSAASITIKGDNWPQVLSNSYYISSDKIVIDSNACPFEIEDFSSLILRRESLHVPYLLLYPAYRYGYETEILFKSEVGNSVIYCETISVYDSGGDAYMFTTVFEGVTIRAAKYQLNSRDDNAVTYYEQLASVDELTIESLYMISCDDPINLGSVSAVHVGFELDVQFDDSKVSLLPSETLFEKTGKASIRQDILATVDHIHAVASDIAGALSIGNKANTAHFSSWSEGKKTVNFKRGDYCVLPFAMAYLEDFVIAECTDSTKEFKKDEWEVNIMHESFFGDYELQALPEISGPVYRGEPIYEKNKLKYHFTEIPESAIDVIIYTADAQWRSTFSEFRKYVRVITPGDMNAMEKRISPNAKNVIVFVTESVESGNVIDLSKIRSDANVFVIGLSIKALIDLATSDEALQLISDAMDDNVNTDKIMEFVKSHITGLMPTVRIDIGQVQTVCFMGVNYASPCIKCDYFAACMSKIPITASITCDYAYYDLMSYKYAKTQKCKSLTLFPIDLETLNVMFVDKVVFSASKWDIHYSCTYVPTSDVMKLCSLEQPYVQTILAAKANEVTIISPSKNIEYVANGDGMIRGIRVITGMYTFANGLPSVPLLEDSGSQKLTNKLRKIAAQTLDDSLFRRDVTLTFSGPWDSVKSIVGPLYLASSKRQVTVVNANKVTAEALSIASAKNVIMNDVSAAKFAHPQYLTTTATYHVQEEANIEFSEIVLTCETSWNPEMFKLQVGDAASQTKVATVRTTKMSNSLLSSVVISKAVVLGYGSWLTIVDSEFNGDIDVTFEYKLGYSSSNAMLTSPEFTPKNVEITYVGDAKLIDTKRHTAKTQTLRHFLSASACNTWKNLAKFTEKEHTGSGDVFTVKLQCVTSGSGSDLQLSFELTDEKIAITIPPSIPASGSQGEGETGKREEVSVELAPSEVVEYVQFIPGQEVTVKVDGVSSDAKVTFTETIVESNTKVIVEATLVLTTSLVMTGDSAIVAGSSGAIEFEAECEVTVVATGLALPMIDIGNQKDDAVVPKKFTVSLDLKDVTDTEVKDTFSGDGKVLVSGYNLDCDKWIESIEFDVKGDYEFAVKCRKVSSGRLLSDSVKREVYVTLDKISGGAIAGIVIGCIAGVALIGGLVYYFVFRKESREVEEP